jgi:hypothetical protein
MRLIPRLRRPSPAMVVAFIALCVALAGTASALPGRKTVKKDDIANHAVRTKHIRKGNVRRSDIGPDAVTSSRVGADSLIGSDILESSLGKVPSATSADSAAISKLIYRSQQFIVLAGVSAHGSVSCDPGFKATGGGVRADDIAATGAGLRVQSTFPNGLDKWDADVFNGGAAPATATVWVVCATVAATG